MMNERKEDAQERHLEAVGQALDAVNAEISEAEDRTV